MTLIAVTFLDRELIFAARVRGPRIGQPKEDAFNDGASSGIADASFLPLSSKDAKMLGLVLNNGKGSREGTALRERAASVGAEEYSVQCGPSH